jgi:hypothetical protein
MKRSLFALVALVLPAAAVLAPTVADAARGSQSERPCASVPVSAPKGTKVESVVAIANPGGTVTPPATPPLPQSPPITDVPAWCDITVTVTHPGANDHATIKISLPQDRKKWGGRFLATGGSAYLAGDLHSAQVVQAVKDGYVAAATDAGIGQSPIDVSGWALTAAGKVNTPLLTNFAARSAHDMAIVGKDVAKRFYGTGVSYSYWNGCSTGGRQGYEEAQDYPTDFDGILATSAAVDWNTAEIGNLWSQAVFNEEKVAPTKCEIDAFTTAAIQACDTDDGVKDGIIDDPQNCHWDARRLTGTKVLCDGKEVTISAATADAVRRIWQGPPSGYGPNKGTDLASLATPGVPFFVADTWAKYFVKRDPQFDATKLDYRSFDKLLTESRRQFDDVIGTNDADLSAFAKAGGKLLSWHGQADNLVPTQAVVGYRERVENKTNRVDDFYRLFLLPGVAHCGAGDGPVPTADMGALVKWVEKGQAPATLAAAHTNADGTTVTRNVCAYPKVARYTGHGSPDAAVNFRCV